VAKNAEQRPNPREIAVAVREAIAERPHHVRALSYHPGQSVHEIIPSEAISEALADNCLLWVDISDPQPEDREMLAEEFHLHPLALEEMFAEHPRPLCAEYPDAYVLVMYAVEKTATLETPLVFREVILYIGKNYLVTVHREPFPEIEEVVRRWQSNTMVQKDSIAVPLYALLDTLVDNYFPLVDGIADRVEDLEDEIFASNGQVQATSLFALKKSLLTLRRVVSGQREALNLLLRQDLSLFTEGSQLYLQSVYDHLVRVTESIDTYRDLLSSAMDMHLSVLSNRMNQVMKTLTVFSTILMSAGLIAGIYGMNFEYMPELHLHNGYYGALGAMVVVGIGLFFYFKRIKFL
jgi:magnesium transporter